jgi:hypothetical protein
MVSLVTVRVGLTSDSQLCMESQLLLWATLPGTEMLQLRLGSSEMTLELSGVSKVTKSKFLKSELTEDIYTGLSSPSGELTMPVALEEDSRFSPETVQTVTVLCKRSTMHSWTKHTVNSSLQIWLVCSRSVQGTTTSNNTTTKNGMRETGISTTEYTHLTSRKTLPRMLTEVPGQLISLRLDLDQVVSITSTTS